MNHRSLSTFRPESLRARLIENGQVREAFPTVPSFLYWRDQSAQFPARMVNFDAAYGGAFAFVDAEAWGLSLDADHHSRLIDYGRLLSSYSRKVFNRTSV